MFILTKHLQFDAKSIIVLDFIDSLQLSYLVEFFMLLPRLSVHFLLMIIKLLVPWIQPPLNAHRMLMDGLEKENSCDKVKFK